MERVYGYPSLAPVPVPPYTSYRRGLLFLVDTRKFEVAEVEVREFHLLRVIKYSTECTLELFEASSQVVEHFGEK